MGAILSVNRLAAQTPVAPVDDAMTTGLLDGCVAVGPDVLLHCCVPGLPWNLLQHSRIAAILVVATALPADLGRDRRIRRLRAHRTVGPCRGGGGGLGMPLFRFASRLASGTAHKTPSGS